MNAKAVFVHRLGPAAASFRYRAAIPAREIGATVNEGEGQVFIFSKPQIADIELAKECKADGCKIVVDFSDDHFRVKQIGSVYVEIAKLADCLVVPTENMAGRIQKYLGRTADAIIPDPYEEPLCEPHANGAEKFVWFGNGVNLKDLIGHFQFMKSLDVTLVTNRQAETSWKHVEWSQQSQTEELQKAQICLLPTRKGVEYKSPNRLVNAIRAGCFVVASAHPAYREFRDVAWTGNLHTGIKWAQHFKDELDGMVQEGQAYVEKYAPSKIGAMWQQVIEGLV